MSHIFISYSRADSVAVDKLAARLLEAGFESWLDREAIRGGEQWRQQIVKAINSCDVFLLMLSPYSVASINVRKELDIADGRDKFILPVVMQTITIPDEMEYQLSGVQMVDLASNFETGFNRLLQDLRDKQTSTAGKRSDSLLTPVQPATPRQIKSGSRYDLVLTKVGEYKINVSRILSDLTDLSNEEAQEMIENAPAIILTNVPPDAAVRVKEAIEAQGATLSLEMPSDIARQTYDVLMTDSGAYKVNVRKAIIELTGLSTEAAEDLLSRTPALILSGVTKDVATATKRTLEAQGAKVKVHIRRV